MSLTSERRRLVFTAAALVAAAMLYGMLRGGGPIAVGYHGSPPKPDNVTEYPVPGSFGSPIADGLDASWVSAFGSGGDANSGQIVKIAADGTVTPYDVGTSRPGDLTIANSAVWGVGYFFNGTTSVPKIIKLTPSTPPQVQTYDVGANATAGALTAGPDGNTWFIEIGAAAEQIKKISATGTITPAFTFSANQYPFDLAAGPDGALWFLEEVSDATSFGYKIGKLNTSTGTITEYPLAEDGQPFALMNGPESSLWLVERLYGATDSITKVTTTGGITRHDTSVDGVFDLASAGGALWFTTVSSGNLGRMTTTGSVSLLCTGPHHPIRIVGGPGATVSFSWVEEGIGRVSTDATGSPCPPRDRGGAGTGGGGTIGPGPSGPAAGVAAADRTAPKASLSGPPSQRFSNGTLAVSVLCNESCRATASATVSTGGASKVFRSGKTTKQLAAGKRTKLTIKFAKKAVKAIRKALRHKRLTSKITVLTRDAAGNSKAAKRNVKLKR